MTTIKMTSGEFTFLARLEEEKTPESSRWLLEQLPLTVTMIQGAWSGRAVFADLHGIGRGVVFEHPTSYPLPGEILLYPGDEMGSTGKYIIRARDIKSE